MLDKNRLMGVMVSKGYTQTRLAKKIGISKNTMNNKINGRGCFDLIQIDKICEALKINDNTEKALIFLSKSSHNRDERH